jgi:hypothetical protein
MSWIPPEKTIKDIFAVEVQDPRASFSFPVPERLSFDWELMILSIGRTQTLSMAHSKLSLADRSRLVRDVSVAIMTHLNIFVDAPNKNFAFTNLLSELADEEKTSLASKVGAAVADLLMEKSGYRFRANARELEFTKPQASTSRKIPDFVYDDGDGSDTEPSKVVVVEAKGSLSKFRATKGRLMALASRAYDLQVKNFVGAKASGIAIGGGCVAAYGAIPGRASSSLVLCSPSAEPGILPPTGAEPSAVGAGGMPARIARSLSAAASGVVQQQEIRHEDEDEEQIQIPLLDRGGGGRGRGSGDRGDPERPPRPNGRIAFANYESVFQLCGATNAAHMIRRSLAGIPEEEDEDLPQTQVFYVAEYDQRFLIGSTPFAPCWSAGYFAIYGPSAEAILDSLVYNRSNPPESVTLPEIPADLAGEDGPIAVQADGLAWLSRPRGRIARKIWDLSNGGWHHTDAD